MSVVQVLALGGIFFVLYRYLYRTIGVERLGIWSLVLASTSVSRIADLGLSASVVKFAAKYIAQGREDRVSGVIQTAALSAGALIGVILLLAYPLTSWFLTLVMQRSALAEALSLLPYALASLWLSVISSVFLSGLDGFQRIDIRSSLLMMSAAFHLVLSFLLIPAHGLIGLALASLIQAVVVMIGSWLLLRRYVQTLPPVPCQWDGNLFKEMLGYGVNFQLVSIAGMLYDPTTKGLLAHFGGLAMVGFYEMAARVISLLRSLIVSANQVLVPAIANLHEIRPEGIPVLYKESYRLLLYLSLPSYSIIVGCAPILSEIWIGHYESTFVFSVILLAIGWFLNTINGPAYFANLGTGELRWNTIGHVSIALLNGGLGFLLGKFLGGEWVIVAWTLSLAVGSNIIILSYQLKHQIPMAELLPERMGWLTLASCAGLFTSLLIYYQVRSLWGLFIASNLILLAFTSIIALPIWMHPMRKRLIGWITEDLLKTARTT